MYTEDKAVLFLTLQGIYKINSGHATSPAIYHTDIVTWVGAAGGTFAPIDVLRRQ